MARNTAESPAPHVSCPSASSVVVGNKNTGPTPQVMSPESLGENHEEKVVSPIPLMRPSPVSASGLETTGIMVLVIRFQSSLILKGQTG